MKKRVYLPYEIEKREFLARIYLASEILKEPTNQYEVVIHQHNEIGRIALFGKPGIFILKSCPVQYLGFMKLMKKRGFKIVLFQEEGIHYHNELSNQLEFSSRCADFIDWYIAWHLEDSLFAQKMNIPASKIKILGNIRFELATKIQASGNNIINDRFRILILENFSMGAVYPKYYLGNELLIDLDSKVNLIQHLKAMSKAAELNFKLYGCLYEELAKKNYDIKIRRYSIDTSTDPIGGFEIDFSDNILEALSESDIVIHYGSTAGLEAILAGRISIILADQHAKVYDKRLGNCSKEFTQVSQLVSFLEQISFQDLKVLNSEQARMMTSQYGVDFSKQITSKSIFSLVNSIQYRIIIYRQFHIDSVKVMIYSFKTNIIHFVKRIFSSPNEYFKKSSRINLTKYTSALRFLNLNDPVKFINIAQNGKRIHLKN